MEFHCKETEKNIREIKKYVHEILKILRRERHEVVSGVIEQIPGENQMANGILPGATGTFVVSWFDGPNGTGNPGGLPAGILPVWTSSDPTNAPVVVSPSDPSGNTVTVTVPTTATPETFTLTAVATLADGTTPTAGPTGFPVLTVEVVSGVINQTS
jgi:hypothetical protein